MIPDNDPAARRSARLLDEHYVDLIRLALDEPMTLERLMSPPPLPDPPRPTFSAGVVDDARPITVDDLEPMGAIARAIRARIRREDQMVEGAARDAIERGCGVWIHRDDRGLLISAAAHRDIPRGKAYEVRATHLASGFWSALVERCNDDTTRS